MGSILGTHASARYVQTSSSDEYGVWTLGGADFAAQDLGQRRLPHLDLRLAGLAGAHQTLDLVAGAPERPGEGRLGMALRPSEHLDGDGEAAERDGALGGGTAEAGL